MSRKQSKIYLNITNLPLQYWWNIEDTGNLAYLVKDADHSEMDQSKESMEVYNQITYDILGKYGVPDTYKKILKKKRKYLIMMNDAILNDDRHKLWRAKLLKKEIDSLSSVESEGKREDSLIKIGKFVYNRPISPMEITLDQYYSHMDYANRSVKLQAASNNNWNG